VLTADAATGSYAFRHALLQEAVYGDLLPGEQVRLHAACARLLAAEPGGAAAELAHHCLASHDLVGALAASVRAAEEAEAVLAPAEALRHLANALRLWERVPEPAEAAGIDRVELTLRAAAAASAAGEPQRAASLARTPPEPPPRPPTRSGPPVPTSAWACTCTPPGGSRRRWPPAPRRWSWCPPGRPPACGPG
jgi:hypothetical protein